MIPKIIHLVWIGEAPFPQKYSDWSASWTQHNPDWQVKIWGNEDVETLRPFRFEEFFDNAANLAEKHDIIRLEILRRFGGISSDCDVLCLRPIPEFISNSEAFISYQAPNFGCCSVMGGAARHPFFQMAMDCLAGWRLKEWPREVSFKSLYVDCIRLKLFPELPIFGPEVFNPEPKFDDEENLLTDPESYPDSITLHTWDYTGR